MTTFLPERPLSLKRGFVLRFGLGSAACLAGALAIAVFAGRWVWEEAEGIRRDDRIWETGTTAVDGSVEGQERSSHFVFYSYDLKVEYRDLKGQTHRHDSSFSSVWTEVDQHKEPVVRYDPNAPDQYALSWAIDLGGARWGSFGVSCFGLLMIVGTLGGLSWALSRQLADARRCASRSDEVLLEVVSVAPQIVNGTNTGAMIYKYRMSGSAAVAGAKTDTGGVTVVDGGGVVGELVLAKGSAPLFTDDEQKTMLALVSPDAPGRPMVMRTDLHPFDLTDEQKDGIQKRLDGHEPWGALGEKG